MGNDEDLLEIAISIMNGGSDLSSTDARLSEIDPGLAQELLTLQSIGEMRWSPSVSGISSPEPPDKCDQETVEFPPRQWGEFEIIGPIGEGGFGQVYRAFEPRLQREVALKLVRPGQDVQRREDALVEEARLLARTRHAHVVTVYGADVRDGLVGIWMELISGQTLEQLLSERGPLNHREATAIGLDLASAMAAVHGTGVVHRDIKTQNVMRAEGGRIVLMDFGAGVDLSKGAAAFRSGTPLYMAPEVLEENAISQRSDIYSLGVLLYRLVTGAYPITASSLDELQANHASGYTPLRDHRPDLPLSFIRVVETALSRDPRLRFESAGALEAALAGAERATLGSSPTAQGKAPMPLPGDIVSLRRSRPRALELLMASAAIVIIAVVSWRLIPDRSAVYDVEASFFRKASGREERLLQGSEIALGDRLFLEFSCSSPMYLYVLNEDDAGHLSLLFPMEESTLRNPIPPGQTVRVPGHDNTGQALSWLVNSPARTEHFLVLASRERLRDFEDRVRSLAVHVAPGPSYAEEVRGSVAGGATASALRDALRGVGAAVADPKRPLFEVATDLTDVSEQQSGLWLRRFEITQSSEPNESANRP